MLCGCAPQVQAGHCPVLRDDSPVGMGSNEDGEGGLAQPRKRPRFLLTHVLQHWSPL